MFEGSTYGRALINRLLEQANHILVVRTDGLGDLLLALPALRYFKESFGSCHITLLTRRESVEIAQLCPDVDEVIAWDKEKYASSLFYRLRFLRALEEPRLYGRDPFDVLQGAVHRRNRLLLPGGTENWLRRESQQYLGETEE